MESCGHFSRCAGWRPGVVYTCAAAGKLAAARYPTTFAVSSMAVFTTVTDDDARTLLTQFNWGERVSLRGITAGIENTNYLLTTTGGEYV